MPDPLARIPTRARLWAAAVVSLVPLGLIWSANAGFFSAGYMNYGDCSYYSDGSYDCTPDYYTPGYYIPGHTDTVAQSALRVFLVLAALAFVVAAIQRRTRGTRLLVRGATVALGWAVVYAFANGSFRVAALLVLALVLTAPLVWGRPNRGVLAPREVAR